VAVGVWRMWHGGGNVEEIGKFQGTMWRVKSRESSDNRARRVGIQMTREREKWKVT
jgi:hypothetical protein